MVLKFDMPVYYVVPLQKIARKNIFKNCAKFMEKFR